MTYNDPTSEEIHAWLDTIEPNFRDAVHLRAIIAACEAGDSDAIRVAVAAARVAGDPWEMIAAVLGTSMNEAIERYGP